MRGSKTYSSVWMNSMRFVTLSLASWKSCGSRTGPARLYTRVSGPERANSCTAVSTAFTTRNLPAAPAGSPRAARAAAAANRRRSQTLCTRRQPPPSRASYIRDCASWNFAIAGLSASVGVMLVRARWQPSAAPQYRSLSQPQSALVSRAAERAQHPGKFSGVDRRLAGVLARCTTAAADSSIKLLPKEGIPTDRRNWPDAGDCCFILPDQHA